MIRKLLFLFLFLPSVLLANQAAHGWCEVGAQPVITSGLNSTTQVQQSFPQCTVTVFVHGGGVANIFSDNNGTPLANPFTATTNGLWLFYAANGHYDIQMSGAGFPTPVTITDVYLNDAANQAPSLACTNVTYAASLAFNVTNNACYTVLMTGNLTVSTTGTPANGNILKLQLYQDGIGGHTVTFPGNFNFPSAFTFLTTPNVHNDLSWIFDAPNNFWQPLAVFGGSGAAGNPAPPSLSVQCNNSGVFGPCNATDSGTVFAINEDTQSKGPNPWLDARSFGVRSLLANNVIPGITGITANINSGASLATVSTSTCPGQTNSVCFVNGDGVVIYGAGATNLMSTPGAPTVTPSVASGSTGVGFVGNAPTGATSFGYKIVARDYNGGLTAASAQGTTSTGNALGQQTVALTSLSRSNTTVSVVTAAPHGMVVGSYFRIQGTSDAVNFDGWFTVLSTADNTHFTYTSALDSRSGASTSATGGNLWWWNCNHLSWTSVTGAWQYYIYGRASGGPWTLIGISEPDNPINGVGHTTWDDFGSPIMDNVLAPPYVPNSAPGAATNDWLSTTILSGAGTTSLTLSANAINTVAGATILFDDCPNFITSLNTQTTATGPVYIPFGQNFLFNTTCNIPQTKVIAQQGVISLNETMNLGGGAQVWQGYPIPGQGGGSTPGSMTQYPAINAASANPGMYANNGNIVVMERLHLQSGAQNNARLLMLDAFASSTPIPGYRLKDMLFSSSGSTDYMTEDLITRGLITGLESLSWCEFCIFTGGPNQGVSPPTPLAALQQGQTKWANIWLNRRGVAFLNSTNTVEFDFDTAYIIGNNMPGVTFQNSFGGGGSCPVFFAKNLQEDTGANPYFTVNGMCVDATLRGVGSTSSGMPQVSGTGFTAVNSPVVVTGQNINYSAYPLGSLAQTNPTGSFIDVNGVGSMGYAMAAPPTSSVVVSAGGSVPTAQWAYAISVFDAFGQESAPGPASAFVTVTTGNQTVTITRPALPAGTIQWAAYRNNPGGGQGRVHASISPASATTIVDTAGFTDGGISPISALQAGFGSGGLETNAISTPNCSSSAAPAVCSFNPAGSVAIAAAATTVTVNTTAVTANSQIIITEDSSLGTKLGVTCNTTTGRTYTVTTRTAATSFVITASAAPAVNPACLSYVIIN